MEVLLGILIPFLGTTLGAVLVFFMNNSLNKSLEKILLGLASGVMIAASIWSLLIPSIEIAIEQRIVIWIPATIGFVLGILFLYIVDKMFFEKENLELDKNNKLLFWAVTLHNIPEGMAVGVAFAGSLIENYGMNIAGAFALAIGIAIQNLPEGAIISIPLKTSGITKTKAFLYGFFSGLVEPFFSLITLVFSSKILLILPYVLAFAAGAMIYVVVEELIPEFKEDDSKFSTFFCMELEILDVLTVLSRALAFLAFDFL